MTHVKVCGITNFNDARAAVACGADSLGFNFYERSSRYVAPFVAREIIEGLSIDRARCVGVFVNHGAPDRVKRAAADAGVGAVQLHGDEAPDYLRSLNDFYRIKALRVGDDFDLTRALLDYHAAGADAVLLDAFSPLARGGTGHTFDWALAAKAKRPTHLRLYLAGGLTADNVARAIRAVRPDAVDVCSGVESAPGIKDHRQLEKFLCAVRDASAIVVS